MPTNVVEQRTVPSTAGNVIHGAFRYDLRPMGHPDNGTYGALASCWSSRQLKTKSKPSSNLSPLSTKFPAFNPPNLRIGGFASGFS
jgi:hypothetical protein